jgi:CRISPR system Cascade subunit CasD
MSSETSCLALLLDGPMQSWGFASRFDRRATALHPTRSGVLGLVASALGIDKYSGDETPRLAALETLRLTSFSLVKRDRWANPLPMERLEDYHTVTGYRRASGAVAEKATMQTYRQFLLDARFGVLLEDESPRLEAIADGLRNPRWGVWLGRKCCIPANPVLVAGPTTRDSAWSALLKTAGYQGTEPFEAFDRVMEVDAATSGADMIEDAPLGFGRPIGDRHRPRWILRLPRSKVPLAPSNDASKG